MREFPEGYEPGWWECPECGEFWHDSQQERPVDEVCWDVDPLCGPCNVPMKRVHYLKVMAVKLARALGVTNR